MTGLPRRHPGPRTSNCFKCRKTGHFRREYYTYARRKTEGSAEEERPLPYRGARRAVADKKTVHGVLAASHCDPCVDEALDTPCSIIRCRKKRGRRRVRCKRPTSLKALSWQPVVLGDGKVVPVDSNPGQQVQRSKEIPTESRCP